MQKAGPARGAALCELELLLLRLQSHEELVAGLPDLRRRYVDVTGNTTLVVVADDDEAGLRA